MYLKMIRETRDCVTVLPVRPRGRPPLLLELDDKLVTAIRSKGGVVNIHVVRATTEALIMLSTAFLWVDNAS